MIPIIIVANYEKACTYRDTRRNISPAIYNVRRELERPIPNVVFDGEAAVIEHEEDRRVDIPPGEIVMGNGAEQLVVERLAAIDIVHNEVFGVERLAIEHQIEHNIDNQAIEIPPAIVQPGDVINANNSMDSLNGRELQVDELQGGNNNEHEAAAHGFQPSNELDFVSDDEVAVICEAQADVADESSVKTEVEVGSAANNEIERLLRDEVQLESLLNVEAMSQLSSANETAANEEDTNENAVHPISTSTDDIASESEIEGAAGNESAVVLYSTDEAMNENTLTKETTSEVSNENDAAVIREKTHSENFPYENEDAISSHSEEEDGQFDDANYIPSDSEEGDGPNESADNISSDSESEGAHGGANVILFQDSDEEELSMTYTQAKEL